jgi:hypothetical protein
MSIPSAWPHVLDFFGTPLVLEPSPGQLSSDAGLLPVRQFNQCVRVTSTQVSKRGGSETVFAASGGRLPKSWGSAGSPMV